MKNAVLYLGLSLAFGAVSTMAQNTTPDGTPARSCLYALKDGASTSIAVPSGTSSTEICDTLGEKQFGKGNYQVKGRQCVWPGGETGDADHTTDYTNACNTAWVLGQ
ncbi:MAG TPA: hypothetical protein VKZ79_19190 [Alphaproteobacteria bacterium]|nr:hypothetical protein [Alphaproteobacteria bacterium]